MTTTTTPERVVPAVKRMTFITAAGQATGQADAMIVASTSTVDREGDIVDPLKMRRDDLRNVPLLWGHDHSSLPIGAVVSLEVDARSIRAGFKWLQGDPFADRVKNAWEQGIVRAASIGFLPHKAEPIERGWRYTDWTLLELSLCPVGAQPDAVRAYRRFGLDGPTSCEQASAYVSELSTQFRQGKTLAPADEQRLQDALIVLRTLTQAQSAPPPQPDLAVVEDDGTIIRMSPAQLASVISTVTKAEVDVALGRIPDDLPAVFRTQGAEPTISISHEDLAALVRDGLASAVKDALRDLTGRID
jgi:HK97 family phage prohead protease